MIPIVLQQKYSNNSSQDIKNMKSLNSTTFVLLLFFILSTSSFLSGQTTIVQGHILLDGVENAQGASITLQDSLHEIINENGEFFFELDAPLKSYHFLISYLGYEKLDTIIRNSSSEDISFDFSLKKKNNETPEVIVTDKRQLNLFKKNKWTILDMILFEESFFLIAIENNKRYLFRYNKEGLFLEKQKMKNINSFFISCLGSLYVKSKTSYFQLAIEEEIKIVTEMSISKFNDNLKPCIVFYDSNVICEYLTQHNKMKKIVRIWNKGERKTIAAIIDKKAAKEARRSYREIIRTYSKAIANPDENSIDYGYMAKPVNIVTDGGWDGDLTRLIIDNNLHQMVSYFLNIESDPIRVLDFFYEEKLYLIDYVNQTILSFDAKNEFSKEKVKFDFDWKINLEVLSNQSDEAVYFYSENDIYKMKTNEDYLHFIKVTSISDELYFKKMVSADSKFVYVFGQENKVNPQMIVKRYSLN